MADQRKDLIRLLQDMAYEISQAEGRLTETMSLPEDLDDFMRDWGITSEYRPMMMKLAEEAEDAFYSLDSFSRRVSSELRKLREETS